MRLIDIDNITALDIMHNVICDKEVAHKMLEFLKAQPTIQPQGIDKDRLEHAIKLLEFCKQRHIDIATDLPHTADREADKISCYEMALKVVRALLQQPTTDGWIPVSERLPENTNPVLVTTIYDIVLMVFLGTSKKWCYVNGKRIHPQDTPVAWQPLPQPYKGSKNE